MRDTDIQRAVQCAAAFSESTGFGAAVLRDDGEIYAGFGDSLARCALCRIAGVDKRNCTTSHIYGMGEAERFGGKYVYFCGLGLTCFTTPVVLKGGELLMITAGPCLMVDPEDYIAVELLEMNLSPVKKEAFLSALKGVPRLSPHRVQALSTLLFMSAGFLSDVFRMNRMLDLQSAGAMQGKISAYMQEWKRLDRAPYPIGTEKALLEAMSRRDRETAQRLLNELLGYILFTTGADFLSMVSRVNELLVLMSRTAIENGADVEETLMRSHGHIASLSRMENAEALCFFLAEAMNEMMESVFHFSEAGHAALIRKAMEFIDANVSQKLTLSEVAAQVFLTPIYFGRVFKRETGLSFSDYVNRRRVEKGKMLLMDDALRLTDIAQMAGFEDQSYFTKVFKRMEGVTPDKYRKRITGRNYVV